MSKKQLYLDITSLGTLQKNGEICCPNCGSWTYIDDITQDDFTGETYCSLCKD